MSRKVIVDIAALKPSERSDDLINRLDPGSLYFSLTDDEIRKRAFGTQRVFENEGFFVNLDNPGAAGVVDDLVNWGISDFGLDMELLSNRFPQKGEGVRIATIDTGIDYTHHIFDHLRDNGRLIAFEHFDFEGNKIAESSSDLNNSAQNGRKPNFGHLHGTHTAAVLFGADHGLEWRGMAPGAEAVVGRVESYTESYRRAFEWVHGLNCDILSLSMGQPGMREVWASEIIRLVESGTIVVAAIGNEFIYPGMETRSPANYPIDGVIAVGAHNKDGDVWPKSGGGTIDWPDTVRNAYGNEIASIFAGVNEFSKPMLCGPGVDIVSCAPGDTYYSESGTSMATPHIAGLMARVLSILRGEGLPATSKDAEQILVNSLVDAGAPGDDIRFGSGIISMDLLINNIEQALS